MKKKDPCSSNDQGGLLYSFADKYLGLCYDCYEENHELIISTI